MYLQLLEEAYASSFCFREENISYYEKLINLFLKGEIIMNNNTKFIKADRCIYREDDKDEVQIRLISEEVVMYTNLNIEEMKKLRDFLNREIECYESRKEESC